MSPKVKVVKDKRLLCHKSKHRISKEYIEGKRSNKYHILHVMSPKTNIREVVASSDVRCFR